MRLARQEYERWISLLRKLVSTDEECLRVKRISGLGRVWTEVYGRLFGSDETVD